jgi:hypothetical protein
MSKNIQKGATVHPIQTQSKPNLINRLDVHGRPSIDSCKRLVCLMSQICHSVLAASINTGSDGFTAPACPVLRAASVKRRRTEGPLSFVC